MITPREVVDPTRRPDEFSVAASPIGPPGIESNRVGAPVPER
ncbi:hypothetical protein [Microlunatus sp. GCM10028923]